MHQEQYINMEDEFDKLMEIFSEESEDKEKKLDEIFQRCTEFFDKYKYIIAQGTDEEKVAIQKKMSRLRDKLKEENEKAQTRLGITPDEIKALSHEPKNFTPKQWDFLQEAQAKLFQEKAEQAKRIHAEKESLEEDLKDKSKKKPTSRKSGWMKS